ncbi:MAG: GtrA family protein [Chloroflexota bacterium]|nr:GtrA family protein [Chloroflexota bacterium]
MSLIEAKETQGAEEFSRRRHNTHVLRFHTWNSVLWQFFRFCLVGGANTAVDVLTFNVLLWCLSTNNVLILVVYNSIAYSSGALNSFFLNKYWTFQRKQRTTRREAVRFAISLSFEVLYSNGLVWIAGKALQPVIANPTLWGNASKLLAVAGSAVLSYSCMRFWIFATGAHAQPKKQEG